ncbi:unnamed protein product [Diabrotica balteata]|uniref:Uncharacterized protein n=1 Tax=Diabrotica balteata TaxID=107213 RepID=A0A9N9SZJ8_DIABA|nr:unnamed protein product [Diabrotica balteata]
MHVLICMVNRRVAEYHYDMAGVSPSSKAPKRVAELPSLQYRAIDVKTGAGVGPNRRPQRPTTTQYQPETIPRRNNKKSSGNLHTSLDTTHQIYRSPRRVRFTLPSKDGTSTSDSPTAPQRSSTAASRDLEAPPLRRQNHKTFSRFSDFSAFSRPTENSEKRRGVGGEKQRRVHDDYASFLNRSTTSVLVTASPGVRNRVHPTGSQMHTDSKQHQNK